MAQKGLKVKAVFGVFCLIGLVCSLRAQGNYKVVNGPEEMYFGHVSLVDIAKDGQGAVVFRPGRVQSEAAVLNMPLGPGDTLRTSGQCRLEIQFDNATIMRLDMDTELKIETILAESLSSDSKITNFVLTKGRLYVMYKEYNHKEIFQVLTPQAAVKFKHATIAAVETAPAERTEVQVEYGKCFALAGPDASNLEELEIAKGKSMTLLKDGSFRWGLLSPSSEFYAWNLSINKNFDELHRDLTPLPKPIQRLPKAVFYFAQTYGSRDGEWIYDDYLGYVWRPFYNDAYPSGVWQPYLYGHWTSFDGRLYWVPDEAWGWVPYHLGVWHWDEKKGWLWIPGSAFSPAWVDWAFFFGGQYCSWRPWSLWDYWWEIQGFDDSWRVMSFWGHPQSLGSLNRQSIETFLDSVRTNSIVVPWQYSDYATFADHIVASSSRLASGKPMSSVQNNELKKSSNSPFEMPKEFAKIVKALDSGWHKNDARLVNSLWGVVTKATFVQGSDLAAPRISEKTINLEGFLRKVVPQIPADPEKAAAMLRPQSFQTAAYQAVRAFQASTSSAAGGILPAANPASRSAVTTGVRPISQDSGMTPISRAPRSAAFASRMITPPAARIVDWNPDVRAAHRLGASIRYLSASNQIYSPELRVSSLNARSAENPLRPLSLWERMRTNSPGPGSDRGGSSYDGEGGSSGGSMSTSSAGSSKGGSSSSSSGSSSGGGHIR